MQSLRKSLFIVLDAGIVVISLILAMVLDSKGIDYFFLDFNKSIATIIFMCCLNVFSNYINGIYNMILRFIGVHDLIQIAKAVLLTAVFTVAFNYSIGNPPPRGVFILTILLLWFFTLASRISLRVFNKLRRTLFSSSISSKRLFVIGAGTSGAAVVANFLKAHDSKYSVVGFVDDDPMKIGAAIYGVKILGDRKAISKLVVAYRVDEILIAIPSANRQSMTEIFEICSETGVEVKIMPRLDEFESGKEVTIQDARDIRIEDLLGRKEVEINNESISSYLSDETVLVTGGGGSIGSELCRQIARFKPKRIIAYDIYENNVYELQMEFNRKFTDTVELIIAIGSVRDKKRLHYIFELYKPGVVFHAAAHKHVPLMESDASEAVKNNVFGTINVIEAAEQNNVKRFILISSDKAVNPTNVMGATKRLCEMVLQEKAKNSKTVFAAVRFGNVLGSNGSVIPLFTAQILDGGPVTLTHEEITRYFMTIPEAAKLVIQAGALANGGEIYVLDMGEPVKIKDLAEDLIRLCGKEPYRDIMIEYVGLRPGEKLYEELMLSEEGACSTKHSSIFVCKALDLDGRLLKSKLEELYEARDNIAECVILLKDIIPTYLKMSLEAADEK